MPDRGCQTLINNVQCAPTTAGEPLENNAGLGAVLSIKRSIQPAPYRANTSPYGDPPCIALGVKRGTPVLHIIQQLSLGEKRKILGVKRRDSRYTWGRSAHNY